MDWHRKQRQLRQLKWVFGGIAAASILAAAILALLGSEASGPQRLDKSLEECPSLISGFRYSVNWYKGPNRLQLLADRACGTKLGEMYELKNVRLMVKSGSRMFASVTSPNGTYWPKKDVILVGDFPKNLEKSACITGSDPILIDLKRGELRSSGIRAELNTREQLSCSRKKRLSD